MLVFALATLLLVTWVLAQSTGSACGTNFCVAARYDGSSIMTYTLTSNSSLTNGWAAVGTGHGMLDSDMYIVWNTGEEVILSQRKGVSASAPMIPETQSAKLDTSNTLTNSSGIQVTWTVPLASLPTGDWPMIWSWNNAGPAGSDSGARLQMHSQFGRMAIPMQAIVSTPSSSVPSTPSAPGGADLAMGYDVAKHDRVVWAHAAMMVLAWGIVCPSAVFIARFGRGIWPRWVAVHQIIQVPVLFVVLFVAISLGIAARQISGTEHGTGTHALLGISVCALYFVQLILGFVVHGLYNPQRKQRPMQNWAHMVLGILILTLAIYTIHTGIVKFGVKQWGRTLYWVWMGLLALAYLVGFALLPRQVRAEREAKAATHPSVRLQNIRTAAQAFDPVSPAPDTSTTDNSTHKGLGLGSSVQYLVNSPVSTERTPSITRTGSKASKGWL